MSEKQQSKIIDPNFEVGDIVELNGKQYQVMAKDTETKPHPGGFKKWDYKLELVGSSRWEDFFVDKLQGAKKIG